jgi:chromosome segregation ATPase
MMIDDRLRSAADELMHELDLIRPPVLPQPSRRPLLVVGGTALVATATVVGLIAVVSNDQPSTTVDQPIVTTNESTPAPAIDTSAQRRMLQARIDGLQAEVEQLTAQIDAMLAQGEQASATQLQVLQQEQSLAIRDLADARDQLAALDVVDANPSAKPVVLQARIDDLQTEIDDLTVQIDALLAQGDQASTTRLQVLQQEQSLAIRDLADARGRLVALDVVDANPSAKAVVLQARIDDLQTEIDDLTVQIDALLAQGDQGSATEMQVLQQRQSLAIRDVADARGQLAELGAKGTSPAEQRVVLQGRIDGLQTAIDDLTVQIESMLAQGGQGSVTELQVLQQEQSQAIRDLADARAQLADLDVTEATPATITADTTAPTTSNISPP